MDVRTDHLPTCFVNRQVRRTRVLFEEYDILFSRQFLPMTNLHDIERCEKVGEDLEGQLKNIDTV